MQSPQRQAPSKSSGRALWQALSLAWELGYTIAIPLVLLALLGRWGDRGFGTSPWLFLAGVILAIVSSTILLIRKFSRIVREMNTPKSQ